MTKIIKNGLKKVNDIFNGCNNVDYIDNKMSYSSNDKEFLLEKLSFDNNANEGLLISLNDFNNLSDIETNEDTDINDNNDTYAVLQEYDNLVDETIDINDEVLTEEKDISLIDPKLKNLNKEELSKLNENLKQ
jgi:hypothetical protein